MHLSICSTRKCNLLKVVVIIGVPPKVVKTIWGHFINIHHEKVSRKQKEWRTFCVLFFKNMG